MKIQTRKSNKKIIIAALALLVLTGIATAIAYAQKLGPFEQISNSQTTTKEEKKTGSEIKKQSIEQSETSGDTNNKTTTGSDPLPAPTPSTNGGKATVGMEITAANQNGTTFNVRTLIQTVSSNGSCTLVMRGPGDSQYTAKAAAQALPSSTTCKGFDIPTSDLSSGEWTIIVTFENDKVTGSAEKKVAVQ